MSVRGGGFVRDVVHVLAVVVWLGGLVVLGAIVAPTVFHHVAMPAAADAMTLVFRRFDRVTIVCAALASAAHALRLRATSTDRPATKTSLVGAVCLTAAVIAALVIALRVSPAIADLHARGAIRGVGALGESLDALHRAAERLAKLEVMALVVHLAALVNDLRGALVEPSGGARRSAHEREAREHSGEDARFRSSGS